MKSKPSKQTILEKAVSAGIDAWLRKFHRTWIPCKTRKPPRGLRVLIQKTSGDIDIAQLVGYRWQNFNHRDLKLAEVVAWMPLPQPYSDAPTWYISMAKGKVEFFIEEKA